MPNVIKEWDTCFGEDPTECQERHPEKKWEQASDGG